MKLRYLFLLQFLIVANFSYSQPTVFHTAKVYPARQAVQGTAVDQDFFYTINSRSIGKYDKNTGQFILACNDTTGRIIHLDGGVVVGEKLYCAHSNFPGIPMSSSIEIFSAKDLKHEDSHSFGIKYGSCTWADFYDDCWWVCFAHYDQLRKDILKGTEWTTLVKFDKDWNEKESWTFPKELISEVRPMSISGGSWGRDGFLYVTGHDSAKVYMLRLPDTGPVLEFAESARVGSHGQGIAWDRSGENKLWGIIRKDNSVVVSEPVK